MKLLEIIKRRYKLRLHRKRWREENPNNDTFAETMFIRQNVKVGDYTYGPLNIEHYYPDAKLSIGKYCSIAKKVTFMLGGNHGTKAITTYPFGPRVYNKIGVGYMGSPKWNVNIVIEDDVWIGYDALILPGVTIGRGAIIGARSVVTKDIPPYSVYAGSRIVKKRFSDEIIEKLMGIDYSKVNHIHKDAFADDWHTKITEDNVDEIIAHFIEEP